MLLRICILLLLGRMFYRYVLGLVVLYTVQVFYFLVDLLLVVLSIIESVILKSLFNSLVPSILVPSILTVFTSCVLALLLGAYMFLIVIYT